MPTKILPKPSRLRLVVLNDSAPVLKMLCNWLQEHGHHCEAALLADMPQAQDEVGPFIQKHRPDVVIYDVGMPYSSSWDLLEVIRAAAGASVTALCHYDSKQAEARTSRWAYVGPRDRRA
jgi:DNA-binding response OmpR family regulator